MRNYNISELEFAYHPFHVRIILHQVTIRCFEDIYAVKLIAIERKFYLLELVGILKYRKDSEEICKKKKV